eukprot:scaffold1007_cov176-Amphora_coffeaeformis.AAC.16
MRPTSFLCGGKFGGRSIFFLKSEKYTTRAKLPMSVVMYGMVSAIPRRCTLTQIWYRRSSSNIAVALWKRNNYSSFYFPRRHNASGGNNNSLTGISHQPTKRFYHSPDAVGLALDPYGMMAMTSSLHFVGTAHAIVHNLYQEAGVDVQILLQQQQQQARVRQHQNKHPTAVSMGCCVDQTIFFSSMRANPELRTTAVAAVLDKVPLAVASLKNTIREIQTIGGCGEDGKDNNHNMAGLLQRIFPSTRVDASSRDKKMDHLWIGMYDAIPVYTTTELPVLRARIQDTDKNVNLTTCLELEGFAGIRLGYSQVLFAADECLHDDRRHVVQAFVQATFAGWELSMQNNTADTLAIMQEFHNHMHFDDLYSIYRPETITEILQNIHALVKQTGDKYGVIDRTRWNQANKWLSKGQSVKPGFALDATLWQPSK